MFSKHEFKLEMFPPADHSVVKVWIFALLFKSTPNFVEIFLQA